MYRIIVMTVVALLIDSTSEASTGPTLWKPGDVWAFTIEYSKNHTQIHTTPYHFHVAVLGKTTMQNQVASSIVMTPQHGTPDWCNHKYRLTIDDVTGLPWTIACQAPRKSVDIDRFLDFHFLADAPKGIPMELVPPMPNKTIAVPGYSTLLINRDDKNGTITMEARLTYGGKEELLIRQTWLPGEKWWTSYERYCHGELDLRARKRETLVPRKKVQPTLVTYKTPDEKPFALRFDPRLQIRMQLIAEYPSLSSVLERLEQATGLRFSLAPNLEIHTPQLGSLQIRQGPAWSIMEMLAESDLDKGLWVRETDGYRLTGQSRTLAVEPVTPRRTWLWITLGVLLFLSSSVVLFRMVRSRKAKVQP